VRGARRPLRVRPVDASAAPEGADALRLRFELPPGSFATVLVEELLAPAPADGAREALRP
jgi:tRNA(Glu) U13 pseudouridine synthase TruD